VSDTGGYEALDIGRTARGGDGDGVGDELLDGAKLDANGDAVVDEIAGRKRGCCARFECGIIDGETNSIPAHSINMRSSTDEAMIGALESGLFNSFNMDETDMGNDDENRAPLKRQQLLMSLNVVSRYFFISSVHILFR